MDQSAVMVGPGMDVSCTIELGTSSFQTSAPTISTLVYNFGSSTPLNWVVEALATSIGNPSVVAKALATNSLLLTLIRFARTLNQSLSQ
ncbi:hypothetical protein U1Q18_032958, partial [Sarracenia purpurea var. burkii]